MFVYDSAHFVGLFSIRTIFFIWRIKNDKNHYWLAVNKLPRYLSLWQHRILTYLSNSFFQYQYTWRIQLSQKISLHRKRFFATIWQSHIATKILQKNVQRCIWTCSGIFIRDVQSFPFKESFWKSVNIPTQLWQELGGLSASGTSEHPQNYGGIEVGSWAEYLQYLWNGAI